MDLKGMSYIGMKGGDLDRVPDRIMVISVGNSLESPPFIPMSYIPM